MLAPEGPVVAARDGRIPGRIDIKTLPAQILTTIFADVGQASPLTRILRGHARTAWSSARFTATRASCTLYPFWLNGLASATAAFAASSALSVVMALPVSACSAWVAAHGVGATCPKTIRAEPTVLPFIFRATDAVASGQSSASFCRIS